MAVKTLKANLVAKDSFSATLKNFATALVKAEKDFQKFEQAMEKSLGTLNNSMTKVVNKSNELARRIGKAYNTMGNQVSSSVGKMENYITKAEKSMIKLDSQMTSSASRINNQMTNLTTSYGRLGQSIDKVQQKQSDATKATIWNLIEVNGELKSVISGVNNLNKMKDIKVRVSKNGTKNGDKEDGEGDSWSSKYFPLIKDVLGGNFSGILTKLGAIGVGITAVTKGIGLLNDIANTGFDNLNAVTDNFFTANGLKESIQEAGGFETGRESLQLFYGDEKGQEIYKMASQVAIDTYASEQDTIDIMSKMGMLGVNLNQDQLTSLIDVAGTRTTMPTAHIGLALKNAIEGNITMLKNYGISSNILQNYLKGLKKTDPTKYKELKKAYNGKSVGDRQAFADLVTDYIKNGSPFNGYAERYAQNTLQGKIERLDGMLQKVRSDIVGMDTMKGEAVDGSLYSEFAKFVDKFKDMLETNKLDSMIVGIRDGLGKGAQAIFDGLSSALSMVDWSAVGEVFKNIGTVVGQQIKDFVSSDSFKKLINMLPDYVDAIIKWKTMVLEIVTWWEKIKAQFFTGVVKNVKKIPVKTSLKVADAMFKTNFSEAYSIGSKIIGNKSEDDADKKTKGDTGADEKTKKTSLINKLLQSSDALFNTHFMGVSTVASKMTGNTSTNNTNQNGSSITDKDLKESVTANPQLSEAKKEVNSVIKVQKDGGYTDNSTGGVINNNVTINANGYDPNQIRKEVNNSLLQFSSKLSNSQKNSYK